MPPMPEVPAVRHSFHDLPTGVRVHVAEAGDPDAPPVLALHGFPQHWYLWREVIPRLAGDLRLICPDLRGAGWSGQPADGDFRKQRLADDQVALLDVLGLERVKLMGHDWGGWVGWLLSAGAPGRVESFLALNVVHPWQSARRLLVAGWRLVYQLALAPPVTGPAVIRDGRALRAAIGRAMDDETARAFLDPLRDPQRAEAGSLLYRHFWLRDVPALRGGVLIEAPVHVLFGRRDGAQDPRQLRGLWRFAPRATVELADAGHFIVDERRDLVADRARALFCD